MRVKEKNVTVLYFQEESPFEVRAPQTFEMFQKNLDAKVNINVKFPAGYKRTVERCLANFYQLHGRIPSIFLFSQLTGLELYVGYPLSIMAIDGILHLATIIRGQLSLFEVTDIEYSTLEKIERGLIPHEQQSKETYRVVTDDITENMVEALKGKKPYSFYGSEVFGGVN